MAVILIQSVTPLRQLKRYSNREIYGRRFKVAGFNAVASARRYCYRGMVSGKQSEIEKRNRVLVFHAE